MINVQFQRELSNSVAVLLGEIVKRNYNITEDAVDIGSYSRGTNTDSHPDLDLLFLGIPHDRQKGFVDWTSLDTFSIVQTWDGITLLSALERLDPVLFKTITQCLQQLEVIGSNSQFQSVRAWKGDPGVVFTMSVDQVASSTLNIDVTLHYLKEHFGVEHAKRFNRYLTRIERMYGEERALLLLEDIRRFKKVAKNEASPHGRIDRAKKVPGFVIEALFTHAQEPLTYKELLTTLRQHEWLADEKPDLPERIQDQKVQLIEANASMNDILHSVTQGGYVTLKTIASREFD